MKQNLSVMFLLLFISQAVYPESQENVDQHKIVIEINSIRENAHLSILKIDESAFLSAQLHAEELAERLNLSHQGLDGSRVTDRYRAAGGTGLAAGENLGAGDNIDSVVRAWLDSPGHRENLLNPKWRKIGVGFEVLESGRIILVAVFTDSRWSGCETLLRDGRLLLSGEFLLSPGRVPEAIHLKHNGRLFEPESVRKNGDDIITLFFDMPVPEEWETGRIAPLILEWTEGNGTVESDLLLLSES